MRSGGKARNLPVKQKEEKKSSFSNVLLSVEQCLAYGNVVMVLMVGFLF